MEKGNKILIITQNMTCCCIGIYEVDLFQFIILYFVLQVWSDWKTKTKKKASLINRDIHGTGGGPGRGKPLSRLEERVLRIIGVTAITGSQAIQEAGFQVSEHFIY